MRVRVVTLGAIISLLAISCASVPNEVVQLSYLNGQEIEAMHLSYDRLIHEFYEQLGNERIKYLEDEWIPVFIEQWIADGKLIETAKGEVVWSEADTSFTTPSPGSEKKELLYTVAVWSEEAVLRIQEKRSELLDPLKSDEDSLRAQANEAIRQLVRSNATITAYLSSLREVKEVQEDYFKALGIKDITDKINLSLAEASGKAKTGLEAIRKADSKLSQIEQSIH